ncbi:hypothetical protein IQ247_02450 [Plectonema cf. radiosum LEGE 06105]|uniref:ATPase AAA-type core domain-containing protein n=1 Tax=Plectonema cf. radiosum LEGE 06105 TaxID=945769 RepID=A0A8J7JT17_9CYAN|nr:AAA family ATPase [Plectonema radiosum]MBE9211585.1 hypothetical protein [Plectonema cf. radiosum LEGE 06105]
MSISVEKIQPNMKLIVFSGIPGTGKSTLSEAIGHSLKIPVFALDWMLGTLVQFRVPNQDNFVITYQSFTKLQIFPKNHE